MKIFDIIRESNDWTRFKIIMLALLVDLTLTIVVGYFFPTSLFITMPVMGTSLAVLVAYIHQIKRNA